LVSSRSPSFWVVITIMTAQPGDPSLRPPVKGAPLLATLPPGLLLHLQVRSDLALLPAIEEARI